MPLSRVIRCFRGSGHFSNRLRTLPSSSHSCCCSPALRRCHSSTMEGVISPHVEDTEKTYSHKIRDIVNDISKLTLLEVADLNELLKKKLNISETPMMGVGTYAAAAPNKLKEEEETAPVVKEKTAFTIRLMKFDEAKKVALIKEIKGAVEGMNLVQAKKFVESLPQDVKVDIAKDEAEKLKAHLVAAGGTVDIV